VGASLPAVEAVRRRRCAACSCPSARWTSIRAESAGDRGETRAGVPVAEVAAGRFEAEQAHLQHASAHLDDITESGRGELGELLRPFYLEYLKRHDAQAC